MAKRQPVVDTRQLPLPFDAEFVEGWEGYRYLECDDGLWHLVLKIYKARVVDTQCSADARIIKQGQRDGTKMCPICTAIQAAKWGRGPYATPQQRRDAR